MLKILLSTFLLMIASGACKTTDFDVSNKAPVKVNEVEVFTQAEYPLKAFGVRTDDGRVAALENFKQEAIPLDILVVIDNSGSMAEEQAGLADKLQPLLSAVSDSSWRVNIINTDADDPQCSRALVVKGDPAGEAKFKAGIEAGTDGSGLERGILRSVQGLECNNDWLRNDSVVAVLIVSDEDNCSQGNGYRCDDAKELNGELLLEKLAAIRSVGETARVYGVLFGPDDDISDCDGNNNVAAMYYDDVISKTKGVRGKICSNDYTETLETISTDLSGLLKNQFKLGEVPNEETVRVLIDEEPYEDFTLDGDTIVLADRLDQGQAISIDYLFGEQSGLSQLKLKNAPVPGSVRVIVDGEILDNVQLQMDSDISISFAEALVGAHEVSVSYQEKVELSQRFLLGYRNFTSVEVTVDGEPVTFQSDPINGYVTLEKVPAPGSEIIVSYEFLRR